MAKDVLNRKSLDETNKNITEKIMNGTYKPPFDYDRLFFSTSCTCTTLTVYGLCILIKDLQFNELFLKLVFILAANLWLVKFYWTKLEEKGYRHPVFIQRLINITHKK
jgi:hypothetical protein